MIHYIAKLQLYSYEMTVNVVHFRFQLKADEAGFGLSQISLRDTIISETCPADPVCDKKTLASPFRTLDGSCNNVRNTAWGKSKTQFQRALVATYADGSSPVNL